MAATLAGALLLASSWLPVAAQDAPSAGAGAAGLLEALALVPDTPEARDAMVGYVDVRAVEAARPDATRPASVAELLALLDADDPAARAWLAAAMGIASGSGDLLTGFLQHGPLWPETVGLDFFDIDRMATFGLPPGDGLVLLGDFDTEAVARAMTARGRVGSERGEHTLWCAQAGCDTGLAVSLADRDPADPFGGSLGRAEPVAVAPGDILGSADSEVVEAMLSAAGDGPALAADPAYRTVAAAMPAGVPLMQATILPGLEGVDPTIYATLTDSPEEAVELLMRLEELVEPMPAWDLAAIADGATGTEQVVSVILSYASEEDAAVAAEVLARRLASVPLLSEEMTVGEALAGRGVGAIDARVVPPGDGTMAAAVIELRAPLAGDEPDGDGRPAASSAIYRFLVEMVMRRDLLWLAPVLPLE